MCDRTLRRCILFISLALLLLIFDACQFGGVPEVSEIPFSSGTEETEKPIPPSGEQITVAGTVFSAEQINAEIKKVFNNVLYYSTDPTFRSLLLGKEVEYDLYFYSSGGGFASSKPKIFLTITNMAHPESTDEEILLYDFGFYATEYGLSSDLCYMAHISQEEHDNSIRFGAVFLGSYCMCIDKISPPEHEQMSGEWVAAAKGALGRYMDENSFYSEAEYNLQPGKYRVYVQGFSKSDADSTVIFEHENGSVYLGQYYFVHSIVPGELADLNHVELVEDAGTAPFQTYLDRVRQNAALVMEYSVLKKAD